MKKEKYIDPELEIINILKQDVLTDSIGNPDEGSEEGEDVG